MVSRLLSTFLNSLILGSSVVDLTLKTQLVGTTTSGMNDPLGWMHNNGYSEQPNENVQVGNPKDLSNFKDGIENQVFDVHQRLAAGQNMHSVPSQSLYMPHTGGAFTNAWGRTPFATMRDQALCLEAGEQSALQSAQHGLNRGGDELSLLNSICQAAEFPSTNVFDGGGEGRSASVELTQFLAKLQGKSNNNN